MPLSLLSCLLRATRGALSSRCLVSRAGGQGQQHPASRNRERPHRGARAPPFTITDCGTRSHASLHLARHRKFEAHTSSPVTDPSPEVISRPTTHQPGGEVGSEKTEESSTEDCLHSKIRSSIARQVSERDQISRWLQSPTFSHEGHGNSLNQVVHTKLKQYEEAKANGKVPQNVKDFVEWCDLEEEKEDL